MTLDDLLRHPSNITEEVEWMVYRRDVAERLVGRTWRDRLLRRNRNGGPEIKGGAVVYDGFDLAYPDDEPEKWPTP